MNSDLPGVVSTREGRVEFLVNRYCEALDTTLHGLLADDSPGFTPTMRLSAAREALEQTGRKIANLIGEEWTPAQPTADPDQERIDAFFSRPEPEYQRRERRAPRWLSRWMSGEEQD